MALSPAALEAIDAHPMFAHLAPTGRDAVLACAREERLEPGNILFHAGEPCQGFYLLVDGLVRALRTTPDGREVIIHLVGPGETFAEAALFADEDYPVTADCSEPSVVVFFRREPFLQLLERDRQIVLGMLGGMSLWLRRLVQKLDALTFAQAPQRLARYLIDLPMQNQDGQRSIELPARKYLIAGQLGMTAPTFSRCLTRLETENLVAVRGNRLVILDPAGLERFADQGAGDGP